MAGVPASQSLAPPSGPDTVGAPERAGAIGTEMPVNIRYSDGEIQLRPVPFVARAPDYREVVDMQGFSASSGPIENSASLYPAPELLRDREAAALLGIGRSKFWGMMRRGEIPGVIMIGPRSRRIHRSTLVAWLNALANESVDKANESEGADDAAV